MNKLFGNMFDFDFDGKTDAFEMAMGFELFSDATMNYYGEEDTIDTDDFDLDMDDDCLLDTEEQAEVFDTAQPESRSTRRARAHSIASDISCLAEELESLQSRIQNAKSDLEALLESEQDILLDLPESLSCSDYESEIESAIDALEDAINCLDTSDNELYDSISELESASCVLDMMDY